MDDQDHEARRALAGARFAEGIRLPSGRHAPSPDEPGEPIDDGGPVDNLEHAARFVLARIRDDAPTAGVPDGCRDLDGRRELIEVWRANRWHRSEPDPLYTRLPFLLARAWCSHPDYVREWNYR